MELPKTAELPSSIAGSQEKITGLQLAGGRIHWEQFGDGEKDFGYIFKRNHGFQLSVDPDQLKSLGVTMDVLMDCTKQLEAMGNPEQIKGSIADRNHPGYLPHGLVITSSLDPRVKMSVMFHDPDYEDTDFLVAWFIDNEHLDHEAKYDSPNFHPERGVDAEELGPAQAQKQREALKSESMTQPEAEMKSYKIFDKNSSKKKELGVFKGADDKEAIKKARKMFWLPSSQFDAQEVSGEQAETVESVLGINENVRFENLSEKIRSDKPEYIMEQRGDSLDIVLKPGQNEDKLAEMISHRLGIEVETTKNKLHLYTDERSDLKKAIHIIGHKIIESVPQFPDLIPSGMTPLFPKKKNESMTESRQLSETGEPDQDYDTEHFDTIVNALAKVGIKAKHKEFDKYQGVYLDLAKGGKSLGRYFQIDYYVTGKPKKSNAKYKKAQLVDQEGNTYSANRDDYFQMNDDEEFEDHDLLLVSKDGTSETIHNPKKKDLPASKDVSNTIEFVGQPDSVFVFAKEGPGHDGETAHVKVSNDGKTADVSELVELVNEQNESKEMKGTTVMEKRQGFEDVNSLSFESVDFWGLPKTLSEDEFTHVGQGLAKPTGKEGTEYGQKAAGKPEYSKSVKEYDSEENKLQGTLASNDKGMKHVQPGDELAKPASKYGTEYGQKELNVSKNVKLGDVTKDGGAGGHVEGTGEADSDGKQFDDLAKNKIKLGNPGDDHGDHVEEAKKLKGKTLVKERMKMPMKKERMKLAKKKGVKEDTEVNSRLDILKSRMESATRAYNSAKVQTESKYVAPKPRYEWQKKK